MNLKAPVLPTAPLQILVVDDEANIVEALERLLRKHYKVFTATSGAEALEIVAREDLAVIISDHRMPKMTGVEFFKASLASRPHAIRILLTGYTDIDSLVDAINSGEVYRYIHKPWDPVDLVNTVHKAVEKFMIRRELEQKNQVLEAALKDLSVLDEAKNQFMMLINHELKTPLTVILSFLELLKSTALAPEQERYCQRIETAGQRLNNMIQDVLLLVRAEAGLIPVQKSRVVLGDLIKGIAAELAPLAELKQQSFTFQIKPSQATKALVDPEILRQVVRRLLENAVRFGQAGSEIQIAIELIKKDQNHSAAPKGTRELKQFAVSITNQADQPLSADTIRRVMKPFQLNENALHHTAGNGLGLSLCQAFLKTHQSELQLSSNGQQITAGFKIFIDDAVSEISSPKSVNPQPAEL